MWSLALPLENVLRANNLELITLFYTQILIADTRREVEKMQMRVIYYMKAKSCITKYNIEFDDMVHIKKTFASMDIPPNMLVKQASAFYVASDFLSDDSNELTTFLLLQCINSIVHCFELAYLDKMFPETGFFFVWHYLEK